MQPTRRTKLASWTLSRGKVPERGSRDDLIHAAGPQRRSEDPKDNKAMQSSRPVFDSRSGSRIPTKAKVFLIMLIS